LGESGENSNVWFRDAIHLVEGEGVGWAFWPLKKFGFNNPLEIQPNPGWAKLVAYWTADGPRPTPEEAEATLMQLARHDIRFENNLVHLDVIDAMIRQPHSDATLPFKPHVIGAAEARIAAVDYDLGRSGLAYLDAHDADYLGPAQRVWWNPGRTYRNDGVDIARDAEGEAYVTDFAGGEWLQYTVTAEAAEPRQVRVALRGAGGRLWVDLNGAERREVDIPAGDPQGWREVDLGLLPLKAGANRVRVGAVACDCSLRAITFAP